MNKLSRSSLSEIERATKANMSGLERDMIELLAELSIFGEQRCYKFDDPEHDERTAELWGDCYLLLSEIIKD